MKSKREIRQVGHQDAWKKRTRVLSEFSSKSSVSYGRYGESGASWGVAVAWGEEGSLIVFLVKRKAANPMRISAGMRSFFIYI